MLTNHDLEEISHKLSKVAIHVPTDKEVDEVLRPLAIQLYDEVCRLHRGLEVLGKEADEYVLRMQARRMWAETNLAVYWKNKFLSLIREKDSGDVDKDAVSRLSESGSISTVGH